MAERLFLVSVGTSLLGKLNERIEENKHPGVSSTLPLKESDWQKCMATYILNLNNCLNQIQNDDVPALSAELSSMFKDSAYPPPTAADSFLLLHTATIMGEVCADRLAFLLRRKLGNNVQVTCYEVEGLSEAQSKDFYAKGLPALLAKLQEELDRVQANRREVILVPTGGYKAIIPYFVIMGLLYDCPCLYVYEDSDLVATLPPLPLHADLARWSSLEAVIETLTGKAVGEAQNTLLYQQHKPMLTLLLQERGGLQPSPLCQVLQAKVTAERRRSELEFRTQHSPLLQYLIKIKGDGSPDPALQEYFLRLAAIGPHIWKGDRVPEMADHALLHHADLFHLAERLLLPIFYFYEQKPNGKPFLTPEELFVLLGALHLHDCGHVVGGVTLNKNTERELLPTEVRDHHHVLGYLRLTEPARHGGTGRWIHTALGDSQTGSGQAWENGFRENALTAIATVGLFHRKAMKLQAGEYRFIDDTPLAVISPLDKFLSDKTLQISGTILTKDRIPLLVALLRIIDSLDEQASRTGGKEAVRFHLELMDTEAQEEKDRAAGLGQALTAWAKALAALCPSGCQEIRTDLDSMIDRLFGTYKDKESKEGQESCAEETPTSNAPEKPKEYTNTQFWSEFNQKVPEKSNGQDNPLRPLALEYVKAKLRAKFKGFQKEPYEEKLPIEGISLEHEIKDGKIHFTIDLVIEENYLSSKQFRQKMLANLKKEYDQENVAKILNDAGIVLNYGGDAA